MEISMNQNSNQNLNQGNSSNPNIRLTENAVLYIKSLLLDMPEYPGIRMGVKASGCSGLSYVLDFIKDSRENDISFNVEGLQIVVDQESIRYLEGMEIDCVQEGLNKQLKFNNPNVKGECGCGESFTVDED
jgi:iron-sulfur cluster assembly protein